MSLERKHVAIALAGGATCLVGSIGGALFMRALSGEGINNIDVNATVNAAVRGSQTPAISSTSVSLLGMTPEQLLATATLTGNGGLGIRYDDRPDNTYPPEFPDNDIRLNTPGSDVFKLMKNRLLEDYDAWDGTDDPSVKASVLRTNSTLSSLVNPLGRRFSTDPVTESGLGQKRADIISYYPVSQIFENPDEVFVKDLAHLNEDGSYTIGVFGAAHDRDAITTVMGLAVVYFENPALFQVDALPTQGGVHDMTVEEALDNQEIVRKIDVWQNRIVGETQEISYPESEAERARRITEDPDDISNMIPAALRESDQFKSCDVFRRDASLRVQQPQSTRGVDHVADGDMTFWEADTENEALLFVLAVEPDTQPGSGLTADQWNVSAFTDRGYYDPTGRDMNQVYAASGEELFPCGVPGLPVEAPASPTPTSTNTIVYVAPPSGPQGGGSVVTDVPPSNETPWFPPVPSVTPGATQPPQSTITPGGGGETPIVNTPQNTPAPQNTAVNQPEVPTAGALPSSVFGD